MKKTLFLSLFSPLIFLPISVHAQPAPVALQQVTQATVNDSPIAAYTGGVFEFNWPHPTLVDIDNDGDFDLFVGEENGQISFFENQGDPAHPHFVFISSSYAGISVGTNAAPAFYDIDNDSDFDLFVGNGYAAGGGGTVWYFENTGSPELATWTFREDTLAGLDAWDNSAPTLGDVDGDGDGDLIVGGGYGILYYSENIGTIDSAIWAPRDSAYGGWDFGFKATPCLHDINCDGRPDLLIGNDLGKLFYYRNDGVVNNVIQWTKITETLTNVDFTHLDYTYPACEDLDNDGDPDILLSESYGNINFFENTGGCLLQWKWVTGDLLSGTIDIGEDADPVLVDIDDDCDLDLFLGKANGQIRFYRNTGTDDEPHWTLVTEQFLGFDTGAGVYGGKPAKPVFCDFDLDGDYDLVIAGMPVNAAAYFENVGTAQNDSFELVSGNFFPGLLDYDDIPALGDFNQDSLTDLALIRTDWGGDPFVIVFYNTGQAGALWSDQATDTISLGPISAFYLQALDYDYDGYMDLLVHRENPSQALWLLDNQAPGWSIISLEANLSNLWPYAYPGVWADANNDFDWDLCVGTGQGGIRFWQDTISWAQYSWQAQDLAVSFQNTSFNGATGWFWDFGDGSTSAEENPIHEYNNPGQYEVCLSIMKGCKTSTKCQFVPLCPLPLAGFDYTLLNYTAVFQNTSAGALSYWWDFGDGSSSNEEHPAHTYDLPGVYEVHLTAISGCGDSTVLTDTLEILTTGTADPESQALFISPNPADNAFLLTVTGPEAASLEMVLQNASGQCVQQQALEFNGAVQHKTFHTDHLPAGVYQLTITADGRCLAREKLVVLH